MVLRGKLLLPDLDVKFVEERKDLEDKIVQLLTSLEGIACERAKERAIDVYVDLLSIIFKMPMVIPPVQYETNKYVANAFEYFFAYIIARYNRDEEIDEAVEKQDLERLMNILEKEKSSLKDIYNYVQTLTDVYEALLYTPADTRPGYNFTSLASHLQLTSILVWLLQTESVDLNYLRISALLHDLGKLIDPVHHVTASVNILEKVIEKSTCLKEELKRVRDLIKEHHSSVNTILQKADRLAASADRLDKIIGRIKDELYSGKCFDKTGEESYQCFSSIGKEKYKEDTIKAYKYVLKSLNENQDYFDLDVKKIEVEKVNKGNVLGHIVYIDFPGIQKFITSFPNLRDMSYASFLVDFLSSIYSFIYIDRMASKRGKTRIPPEALLSGYGGHSYIVVRSDIDISKLEEIYIERLDVKLDVKVADFAYDNYVRNYNEIWNDFLSEGYKRYLLNYKETVLSLGFHRVCSSCGIRPAVEVVGEEELCERCAFVRKQSRNRGFMAKVNSTYILDVNGGVERLSLEELKEKIPYSDKIGEYAMEFIAGYKSQEDSKYLAVIKADGNDAGKIFKSVATFSDYIDRSFRLDYGVKKAFHDTLVEIVKESRERKVSETTWKSMLLRILSGVLYMGGDDVTLLVPSIIAIPFAVNFFEKAEKYTGFKFKVGVISVKPDHPIQFAFFSADELMESAKIESNGHSISSISCLVFSSSLATREVVSTELRKYTSSERSLFRGKLEIEKVKEMLKVAQIDIPTLLQYYENEKEGKGKIRDRLRPFEEIVNFAESHNLEFFITLAFTLRKRYRSDDDIEREVLKHVLSQYKDTSALPIYDYYFIFKSLRVGLG